MEVNGRHQPLAHPTFSIGADDKAHSSTAWIHSVYQVRHRDHYIMEYALEDYAVHKSGNYEYMNEVYKQLAYWGGSRESRRI